MRLAIPYLFFLWVTFIQNCFAAESLSNCQQGDWTGKIGYYPVVMRFFNLYDTNEILTGKYYYQNYNAQELTLKQKSEALNQWEETDPLGKVTGTLILSCNRNIGISHELVGQWQSSDATKTLPVQLEYIDSADKDKEGYYQSRLGKPRIAKIIQLGKHRYSEVSYPDIPIQSVQLQGDSEGLQNINQTLLTGLKNAVSGTLQCKEINPEYGDEITTKISMWEKDFVVVHSIVGGYCGGAHGYWETDAETYDLADGTLENLNDWFQEEERFQSVSGLTIFGGDESEVSKNSEDDEIKAFVSKPSLMSEVVKQYLAQRKDMVADTVGDAKECLKEVLFSTNTAWPTSNGLIIKAIPNRDIVVACGEEVLIPYSITMPYLSEHGKTRVRSIGKAS